MKKRSLGSRMLCRGHVREQLQSQFQRPGLPWRGFSFEEGYSFSHLDGFLEQDAQIVFNQSPAGVDPELINPLL